MFRSPPTDPPSDASIQLRKLGREIATRLVEAGALSVCCFGSVASGVADCDSDIDVLCIVPVDDSSVGDRVAAIVYRDAATTRTVSLVTYTPDDVVAGWHSPLSLPAQTARTGLHLAGLTLPVIAGGPAPPQVSALRERRAWTIHWIECLDRELSWTARLVDRQWTAIGTVAHHSTRSVAAAADRRWHTRRPHSLRVLQAVVPPDVAIAVADLALVEIATEGWSDTAAMLCTLDTALAHRWTNLTGGDPTDENTWHHVWISELPIHPFIQSAMTCRDWAAATLPG